MFEFYFTELFLGTVFSLVLACNVLIIFQIDFDNGLSFLIENWYTTWNSTTFTIIIFKGPKDLRFFLCIREGIMDYGVYSNDFFNILKIRGSELGISCSIQNSMLLSTRKRRPMSVVCWTWPHISFKLGRYKMNECFAKHFTFIIINFCFLS